ncbi:glycosyltransferase family 4 protein [Chitinilyticum piscinae]|uniref:Glycosyltransferase family 4 protein n=1 Tax=Chitinilyticum piscinae TaxID=2866724 RepID=A0A8J7FLX4_9NEIS|nr:glycosyltransferase family 4 protein [Chitinilyticum piscinae]MBE9610317.1 glycosyltransferase family 4 protein [Chitinilyticum piscinae]
MRYLLIHQNFPGQYKHLFPALAKKPDNLVVGIGEEHLVRQRFNGAELPHNMKLIGYKSPHAAGEHTHPYLKGFEGNIRRGQQVTRVLLDLKKRGFYPDILLGHPGWGEMLFARDVFPKSKIISFCEFYYRGTGADVGFDPEFGSNLDDYCRIRVKNSTLTQALLDCDLGIAPTEWQKSVHPPEFHHKIAVVHDGIDTVQVAPNPEASFTLADGRVLTRRDQVVTFVNRNLEPYRGFHSFMRALPIMMAQNPHAQFVVVGGDDVSYGRKPPEGGYRKLYLKEVADKIDHARVHFTGKLPYHAYLSLLQISSAHLYLTYPFVLSWSMIEAMSAGCIVIGSNTTPVTEVIKDGRNGLLVDFFDHQGIAATITRAMSNPTKYHPLREQARLTAISQYDLQSVCLPKLIELIHS